MPFFEGTHPHNENLEWSAHIVSTTGYVDIGFWSPDGSDARIIMKPYSNLTTVTIYENCDFDDWDIGSGNLLIATIAAAFGAYENNFFDSSHSYNHRQLVSTIQSAGEPSSQMGDGLSGDEAQDILQEVREFLGDPPGNIDAVQNGPGGDPDGVVLEHTGDQAAGESTAEGLDTLAEDLADQGNEFSQIINFFRGAADGIERFVEAGGERKSAVSAVDVEYIGFFSQADMAFADQSNDFLF